MKNKGKIIFIVGLIMMLISSVLSLYASKDVLKRLQASINHSQGYVDTKPLIYPVGSIYLTVTDDTVEKIELKFGGTWERFGEGKTLVSVDSSYPINTTGGSISESYTPSGTNTGMALTMNLIELTHSGGAVQNTTLTESQIPKIDTGTITLHGQESGTMIYNIGSKWYGSKITNQYKTLSATSGAYSHGSIGFKFGGGGAHNHGFTQPNKHSFTPSVKSYTNPIFTGTEATISHIQPYITVYMYKRVS